jgi:hypothetical protein
MDLTSLRMNLGHQYSVWRLSCAPADEPIRFLEAGSERIQAVDKGRRQMARRPAARRRYIADKQMLGAVSAGSHGKGVTSSVCHAVVPLRSFAAAIVDPSRALDPRTTRMRGIAASRDAEVISVML